MEQLAQEQSDSGATIERFFTNFKKDGPARKTRKYLLKRSENLEAEWNKFAKRHEQLQPFIATHAEHAYFKQDFFAQVQRIYATYKAALADALEQYSSDEEETFNQQLAMEQQRSIRQQKATMESLQRLLDEVEGNLTSRQSHAYYSQKLTSIRDYWHDTQRLHSAIMAEENQYDYNQESFLQLEDRVQRVMITIQEQQALNCSTQILGSVNTQIKLPKIKLPIFDGNYIHWKEFRDLYVQLIHQQSMSPSEKMFYLKAHLTGEASKLIQHLGVSDSNYHSAWQLLEDRYNNQRLLVSAFLNKLLGQPAITNESAAAIKRLHDVTNECLLGIANLGIPTNQWDPLLLHILLSKLDKETHRLYEQSLQSSKELQKIRDFLTFLEKRFQMLEALGTNKERADSKARANFKTTLTATANTPACPICKAGVHPIFSCHKFLQLRSDERLRKIQGLHRCINCLKAGHNANKCPSRRCCKCNGLHNTLLHVDRPGIKKEPSATTPQSHQISQSSKIVQSLQESATSLAARNTEKVTSHYVLLGTAIVNVLDCKKRPVTARALLDSGSQVNFITERLHKKLGLGASSATINISSIGNKETKLHQKVDIEIHSRLTGYATRIDAFILPHISALQPSRIINIQDWSIPQNLQLADNNFHCPAEIDILIGAELFPELMSIGQIKLGHQLPILQNTLFGWVVIGKVGNMREDKGFCGVGAFDDISLDEKLQQFWALEEVVTQKQPMTELERECEEYFKSTTKRTASGRYIVSLPFKGEPSLLGSSKEIAVKRFFTLERKLGKNKDLRLQYTKFMKEYEELRHMEEVTELPLNKPHYFLPHHCVLRPESSTTKLRVVFDGSSKTSTGVSLNDILHTGPLLQNDLFSILVRFRTYRYVFTCDITKMYRQIIIDDCDKQFQLIVWRNSSDEPLKYFRLNTVTYGTRSAPYLAIRCLRDLAEVDGNKYPLGARVIKHDFYVDDALTGSNDFQEALLMRNQLTDLLKLGGFELRKWCTNTPKLLEGIPKEDCALETVIFDTQENNVKTLGLTWIPSSDQLLLNTSWQESSKITKRTILADIAHIFDPLGIINPVIVLAKLFMQELWKLKLDWDAAVPVELYSRWLAFREELKMLNGLRIPRHIVTTSPKIIHIHAFSDASEKAYGAVVYLRSVSQINVINSHIICAKSRVKPQKSISMPRLELCAAKLMVELVKRVINCLPMGVNKTVYWTDSQIVLSWLQTSSPLERFVANRIAFIQEETSISQWRFIRSHLNPADLVSRGASPQKLLDSTMWFKGPIFLQKEESHWPENPPILQTQDLPEVKRSKGALFTATEERHFLERINHKNSFKTLQRVTAYILRFIKNVKSPQPKTQATTALSPQELQAALTVIARHMQASEFEDDIKQLKSSGRPTASGRLSTLTPFIDEAGLIRIGGRLQESSLSYEAKHPIILPSNHSFTELLLTQLHWDNYHVGPRALVGIAKQRFWPLRSKQIAQKIVHKCVKCFKAKPRGFTQLMGDLPSERVQPSRPFTNVGIDYFGPVYIHYKLRGKRPTKAYVAVFVCFATKATHFEVVTDLTTDAFLGALKRFIARRGCPAKIFSDNASNFTGARTELAELHDMLNTEQSQSQISEHCAHQGIEWQTIPPRSPHMGGLWEAAVKSAKNHMKHVLKGASLTFEELTTVINQIEAILNSRPLTPISTDANDLEALTPGHFLIGAPLTTYADPVARAQNSSLHARWNRIKAIHQEFWRRWSQEYLQELQTRHKWKNPGNTIKPGTLVLLKEDNLPPMKWRMGRVLQAIKGTDGHVRVLNIKTSTGETQRSVHRICPLPVDIEEDRQQLITQAAENPSRQRCSKRTSEDSQLDKLDCTASKKGATGSNSCTLRSRVISPLVTLLLVLASIGSSMSQPTFGSPIEVKKFTTTPGIYFEDLGQMHMVHNEWNIIAYFNMTNYRNEFQGLQNCVNELKMGCINIIRKELCDAITSQLEQNLLDIEHLNFVLYHRNGFSRRNRRSPLDIVGTLSNKLFGILDQNYATQIEETIIKFKNNDVHLLNLIKNQTSIIEATTNVLKRSNDEIKKQFQLVDNQLIQAYKAINDIEHNYNESQRVQFFNSLVAYTTLLMIRHQRTQLTLLDILTDTHQGKLDPLLLTPEQLQQELIVIRKHLSPDLVIPGHDQHDLISIYELAQVKARMTEGNIIFIIRLPLLSSEFFQLFKLIPLPAKQNDSFVFIQPSTAFLAVNLHRDHFYPISQEEFQECMLMEERQLICKQRHPIFNSHSTQAHCEINLLNHKERLSPFCQLKSIKAGKIWIQLHNPNHWIFALDEECVFNIVCGTKIINQKLYGEGLLKLQPNCAIRQPTMIINAHNTYSNHLALSFIPAINLTKLTQHTQNTKSNEILAHSSVLIRGEEDFTAISKSLQNLKDQEELPENISSHDIHQYSISYVTLAGIIAITGALCFFKFHKSTPTTRKDQKIDPAFELKELKSGEDVEKN